MFNTYIYSILLCITAIIGTITYKKYKESFLKYFLYFLWYDFFNESLAIYIGFILKKSTFLIYNIYILISFIFYLLLFHSYSKKNKFYLKLLLALFLVFYVINVLFFQKSMYVNQSNTILIGSLFMIISTIILFSELLKSDVILHINKLLLFWISIGILIFYTGIIPIYVMVEFLDYQGIFDYILLALNIIMLSCFSIGFIVSTKEYNK